MLKDINFKVVYASGEEEPVGFFIDALLESSSLDLGLGYFSSSGIRTLSVGFAYFIKTGGKIRILINNILSYEDKEAIEIGLNSKPEELIEEKIINDIKLLEKTLSRYDKQFFKCISWLISTKKIELVAIVPSKNTVGIAHQKFGIFKDEYGSKIAFNGSANFSSNAFLNNLESISCYKSWTSERSETERLEYYENLFEKIWNGKSDSTKIIPLEKVKTYVLERFPVDHIEDILREEGTLFKGALNVAKPISKQLDDILRLNQINEAIKPKLKVPYDIRPYQLDAIKSWFDNNYIGLFEMATGTGKTITALSAAVQFIKNNPQKILLISCPYIHLVEQWSDEALNFGFRPIIVAESSDVWSRELARELQLFKRGSNELITIITTNVSFTSQKFQNLLKGFWNNVIFISDECHYLGSTSIRKCLPIESKYRLGLTATPKRYYDDEGTDVIFNFFNKVVYSLPLDEAIGKFLTPYYYYPIPVEMKGDEFAEYSQLTKRIKQLACYKDEKSQDLLEKLAIKRARVQNNSISKVEWVSDNIINNKDLYYTLFYAGDIIFPIVKTILGVQKHIKIHQFTGEETRKERKNILERFSKKDLQALIAMKCLDEGVDIPPTRTAIFLASSGNPKEFIQRRGRILRKFEGKEFATIYDLIAIPPINKIFEDENDQAAVKASFQKEFKRVREFSNLAINKNSSFEKVFDIALKLNILGD